MRVYNFSAGPAALPEPVLRQAADEMLDWRGAGMSVLEMSHRSAEFLSIHAQALADLRELLAIPSHYRVLFMQGGALAENAIVPLNLMGEDGQADYVVTGHWSERSAAEAARYGRVNRVTEAVTRGVPQGPVGPGGQRAIPGLSQWRRSPDAAYLHLCLNETVDGIEFHWLPGDAQGPGRESAAVRSADLGSAAEPALARVPIVADASSTLLSRRLDVSRFGCLYAGAQKNMGPAGLTVVILREDLLGRAHRLCPSAFNYQVVADHDSMFNTPPTYAIYLAGLVFQWIKGQGGLEALEALNARKAALLYGALDASALYENRVRPEDRSRMNVTFYLRDERLEAEFLAGAREAGLAQLKGHRSVGGLRASIYNAMPLAGVEALVDYLRDFERRRG